MLQVHPLQAFSDGPSKNRLFQVKARPTHQIHRPRLLIGFDDQLITGYTRTDGSKSGYVSYDFPVSPFSTRGRLLYSRGAQDIVGGEFAVLGVTGRSEFASAKLTQPVFVSKNWRIDIDAEYSKNSSETDVVGVIQENDVDKKSIGININKLDSKGAWLGDIHGHKFTSEAKINNQLISRDSFTK